MQTDVFSPSFRLQEPELKDYWAIKMLAQF